MSDYDNDREDAYGKRQEAESKARDAEIDFHTDNWLTAVTKSVEKSHGTFDDEIDYAASKELATGYVYRKATSADVLITQLIEGDFMERAAQMLIDIQNGKGVHSDTMKKLFDDMAASYAEFQFEKSL